MRVKFSLHKKFQLHTRWPHCAGHFAVDTTEPKVLCKKTLSQTDLEKLSEAIEDLYYFEFVIGGSRTFLLQFPAPFCVSFPRLSV